MAMLPGCKSSPFLCREQLCVTGSTRSAKLETQNNLPAHTIELPPTFQRHRAWRREARETRGALTHSLFQVAKRPTRTRCGAFENIAASSYTSRVVAGCTGFAPHCGLPRGRIQH